MLPRRGTVDPSCKSMGGSTSSHMKDEAKEAYKKGYEEGWKDCMEECGMSDM